MTKKQKAKGLFRLLSECPELINVCGGRFDLSRTRVDFFDVADIFGNFRNFPISLPSVPVSVWFSWVACDDDEGQKDDHLFGVEKLSNHYWTSARNLCLDVLIEYDQLCKRENVRNSLLRILMTRSSGRVAEGINSVVILRYKLTKKDDSSVYSHLRWLTRSRRDN